MHAIIDFPNDQLVFKNVGHVDLEVDDANHYILKLIPSTVSSEHAKNIWLIDETRRSQGLDVEGVGRVSPPRDTTRVEGPGNVIPPYFNLGKRKMAPVEGGGGVIPPRDQTRVEGPETVIPPVEAFPTREEPSSSSHIQEPLAPSVGPHDIEENWTKPG